MDSNTEQIASSNLHVELIPGTHIMRDVDDVHFIHGPKSGEVLIPPPSGDPHDPLNWSIKWKYIAITVQFLYLFVCVALTLSMGPMFPYFAEEFKLDDVQQSLLTGACVLGLGYANLIIVPISNILGRRQACLIFCILGIGTCIWQALSRSYAVLIGGRVINGIATATSESIMMQVVADMFFLHERGVWTGIYFMGYFMGLFIGPIISGNIAQRFGWRSFFWLSLALSCFNLITLLIFFPETKRSSFSKTSGSTASLPPDDANKKDIVEIESANTPIGEPDSSMIGKGSPSKAQFGFISAVDRSGVSISRDLTSCFRCFFYPIILWAGLNVAGPANLLLFWNLTDSSVLGSAPYNFSSSAVGYSNFGFVVGGIVGLATAGRFSDWIATRATQRNGGVREPEMRLPALIPYTITTIIGITIGGLAYQRLWPWPVTIVVGYGLTGLCVTSVPTIAIAYAIDCYKPVSGEIMIVATIIKNSCGFAMSFWVSPLAARQGMISVAGVQFALTVGPLILGIPIYFWGKNLRRLTKDSELHRREVAW